MLCIGWLLLLFWLSSQDGQSTAQTSMGFTTFVAWLFSISPSMLSRLDHLLRSAAHFAGFFILSGLAYMAARVTWPGRTHAASAVLAICIGFAVLDEVVKILIPGRHLSWPEVGLNVLGIFCGALLSRGILWLAVRWKTQRDSTLPPRK
jgi:VanZ family protein